MLYLGCPASEREQTEQLLASSGISVVWAEHGGHALAELQRRDMPVLVDLSRGATALQLARELRLRQPEVLLFAVVDDRRPELTTEAVLAGVADVFARPLGGRRVAGAIEREIRRGSAWSRRGSAEVLYSQSTSMRQVVALIDRAAAMRAGVIIRGEEGTGRRLVARAIHAAHSADAPFVSLNCGAYDPDELDRALFGNRTGSHAAAATRGVECVSRDSRLHEASGGTLHLQNLAHAPTRVQARLARVFRDREAVVGDGGATISLDVRPMVTAGADVDTAAHEGRIHPDLVRRVSVLRIDMPPFRNRREDIPAIANYLLRDICASMQTPPKTLSRPALSLISALPWRGNAIELRTMLERVVSTVIGAPGIGLEDILAHVHLDGGPRVLASATLRQARVRFEREYIAAVLEQHQGRISDAAKTLGIQRTNLYRKLRTLQVGRGKRH